LLTGGDPFSAGFQDFEINAIHEMNSVKNVQQKKKLPALAGGEQFTALLH
jgi:L-lysine 2,3-aminomutase